MRCKLDDLTDQPLARRCILCANGGPFELVYRENGQASGLFRCGRCGLIFRDPQPDDAALERSYYHDPAFTAMLVGPLRSLTLERASQHLSRLQRQGLIRPGMKILDVGCSSGAWLEVARAHGACVEGIEVGEATAAEARRRGLPVHTGTFEECLQSLAQPKYDLITFWDVLEHLRDPRLELKLARELLVADGKVAATFPNVDGWYPKATYKLLARRTGVWEYPEPLHLYEFSPATARGLLCASALDPLVIKTIPTPFFYYRETTLSLCRLGRGIRGLSLRLAFELLHITIYPLARTCGRDNSLFVVAAPGDAASTRWT
jgi:SAM-dependent methyltransferase